LNWKEAEPVKSHRRSLSLETKNPVPANNEPTSNNLTIIPEEDDAPLRQAPYLKAHRVQSMATIPEEIKSQLNASLPNMPNSRGSVSPPPPNRPPSQTTSVVTSGMPIQEGNRSARSPPLTRPSAPSTPTLSKKELPREPPNFYITDKGKDFLDLLLSHRYSDVRLIVNEKEYWGHKLLLAYSSEYFSKLFVENPLLSEVKLPFGDTEDVFSDVMHFIYGGNLVINEANAIPLLALSDNCQIDALKTLVSNFLTSKIRRDNATLMLKKAAKSNVKGMIDKCLFIIAKHFCYIYDADYNFLPYNLFMDLLKHPNLHVKEEYELYNIIAKYIEAHKATISNENIYELFQHVRYRFIPYKLLEEVIKNPMVPRDFIVEAGMFRLAEWEKAENAVQISNKRLQPRPRQSVTLDYAGDGKGILYWIGTNCEKEPWQNPATRGVRVTASSIERGQPMDLVRKLDTTELWTKDVPASWFCIDLGLNRKACPTYYTLVHGGNYEADILRTWYFQGSNDGENWIALRKHTSDVSLSGKFESFSWPVEGVTNAFRYFRILQTGHNSSNRNFLVLSGIEIYGELYEE